ncbi:oxoglutarate dehydrogenase (succinyl-transferring), E1 component [Bacteriovorax sp. BAL6_X]|uniref:2-oxoglutarate dehydrogenase E1 component n=1 Tax=Bacteriovorax sp. BAL6_X TaxID=1201290 RepID=UPI00038594DA|nr:2-oxoglutarate dehydrogenase E1 component [Bacteriovorax sp. BAL6_X]EPZ51146.1 oxoglutarate dehydrogenase (succinyl-transferring), E1 component [Bacteriovorax sp. BAL6_X]
MDFNQMDKFDFSTLSSSDISYIDSLYEQYESNPMEVEESWRNFFLGFEFGAGKGSTGAGGEVSDEKLRKEFNVFRLIQSFRSRGHLLSDTNPIRPRLDRHAHISLQDYDLTDADLNEVFTCGEFVGLGATTLKNIMDHMSKLYCGKIGVEYMHSTDTEMRRWFREEFETTYLKKDFSVDKKKRILHKLNEANVFENFLQTKYTGQKRFSLEGGESTIPGLDAFINEGARLGAKEFIIGMAHRGRLNILANTLGKTYEYIFSEFEGNSLEQLAGQGDGDVKYHMGFTSVTKTEDNSEVYLKLLPNPSHLETVSPVATGYARAQIDIAYGGDESKIIPIVIHGDAAVAGQGIVYETLQMSELPGYRTGGSLHFVINNQIGFTTDFTDARSSHYSTSVAKMLNIPVIHVNGDCPEDVVYACELAVKFRQKFKRDVFVDMVCYRKHGHNEGDEPKYTQPELYGMISKHKNPREMYIEELASHGSVDRAVAKEMQEEYKSLLSDRFNNVKQNVIPKKVPGPHREWKDVRFSTLEDFANSPDTSVDKKTLENIISSITQTPEGFKTLRKAQKLLDQRKAAFESDQIDWALAELFAYGSILTEGNDVRFSGEDVIRGTFSHRHAKVFDEKTNEAYCGLEHLTTGQGDFYIYNSLLSEYAVLAFEYGYSQATPHALNIWEAQFGDFTNGAQIVIDQFISAAESKWRRMSNLVMLLPHGYEGAGPEHSSCRPERFLQQCAEENMVICNITTPANMFHALRRQLKWEFRKPLVVFTPKSLLRHPLCQSKVEDFTSGKFEEVFDDSWVNPKDVKKVVLCTGKIYYDLLKYQQENDRKDVAVVRLEQLYPLPTDKIKAILDKYPNATHRWVQEEPSNMGAWMHLNRWRDTFREIDCISRKASASPATGYASVHMKEQETIVENAFK